MSAASVSDIASLFERQIAAAPVSLSRKLNNQKDDEEAYALPRRRWVCVVIALAHQT
jgi:hypothetical protein